MTILKRLLKTPLDVLAFFLRSSRSALYYLVNEALRDEIKATSELAFAHEHIENACFLAKKLKNTEGVILDVGGGTATTAVLFSRHFPKNPVWVFEPLAQNFAEIQKAATDKTTWRLFNNAVGSRVEETFINVAARSTASSLLDMNDAADGYGDYLKTESRQKIHVTTLDSVVPNTEKVLILKMDVQGFELEVLRGAKETLKRTHLVVVEINNHDGYRDAPTYFEIDAHLREAGFQLYDIHPNAHFEGKLQDWDAIYLKK